MGSTALKVSLKGVKNYLKKNGTSFIKKKVKEHIKDSMSGALKAKISEIALG